jgi:hypothetical protein
VEFLNPTALQSYFNQYIEETMQVSKQMLAALRADVQIAENQVAEAVEEYNEAVEAVNMLAELVARTASSDTNANNHDIEETKLAFKEAIAIRHACFGEVEAKNHDHNELDEL